MNALLGLIFFWAFRDHLKKRLSTQQLLTSEAYHQS
jgi:hypothetical protein